MKDKSIEWFVVIINLSLKIFMHVVKNLGSYMIMVSILMFFLIDFYSYSHLAKFLNIFYKQIKSQWDDKKVHDKKKFIYIYTLRMINKLILVELFWCIYKKWCYNLYDFDFLKEESCVNLDNLETNSNDFKRDILSLKLKLI